MQKKQFISLTIIILVACLSQVGSDIYSPSLPAIAHSLNTSIKLTQITLAIYMLGIAIAQLTYGPISEAVGRKKPLITGLFVMMAGSLTCMLAPNVDTLIAGRLLQGLGAGACSVLWRSIFRDLYSGEAMAKVVSYLGAIIIVIIPTAPVVGSYLQHAFGWRSIFIFLIAYGLVSLGFVYFAYEESSKHHHDKNRRKISFVLSAFARLIKSRVFIGYSLAVFLTYGAFFGWFAAGPILLIKHLHVSVVHFGWITFLLGSITTFSGNMLNGKLINKLGIPFLMRMGWCMILTAGVLSLLFKWIFGLTVWGVALPAGLSFLGMTFIWANSFACAFQDVGDIAGYASALYGSLQMSGAFVFGWLLAHLPKDTPVPLGLIYIGTAIGAWLLFEFVATYKGRSMELKSKTSTRNPGKE